MSDGSNNLYFLNRFTFQLEYKLPVTYQGGQVYSINELEYVDGYIYANQWPYNVVMVIDASNGNVVQVFYLDALQSLAGGQNPYLNGIAHNPFRS